MFGKLILLILIVLAAAFSIPKTRAMLMKEATPLVDKVKEKMVPGRLHTMVKELVSQMGRGDPLPASANDWAGWLTGDYTGDPNDPWGHHYYYQLGRRGFTVGSMGPDGVRGDSDDITLYHAFKQ